MMSTTLQCFSTKRPQHMYIPIELFCKETPLYGHTDTLHHFATRRLFSLQCREVQPLPGCLVIDHDRKGHADNPECKLRPAVGQGSGKPRRLNFLLEVDFRFAGGAFYAPRDEGFVERLGERQRARREAKRWAKNRQGHTCIDKSIYTRRADRAVKHSRSRPTKRLYHTQTL